MRFVLPLLFLVVTKVSLIKQQIFKCEQVCVQVGLEYVFFLSVSIIPLMFPQLEQQLEYLENKRVVNALFVVQAIISYTTKFF